MSSNIARDQYGYLSVYADEKPWHPEVGAIVKGAMTAEQVIKRSRQNGGIGLGFVVETQPAAVRIGKRVVDAPGFVAITRKDTREVFGFGTDKYTPIQNVDVLRLPEAIVGTKQAGFISAGAIGNGARLFATLDLSRLGDVKIPGDPSKHKPLLSMTWAHDGLEAVRIAFWDRRIECANMRQMFLSATDKGGMVARIRHTGDVADQITEAQRILGFAKESIAGHTLLMSQLAEITTPKGKWLDGFLENLIPIPQEMERPVAREEARAHIADLYKASKTLVGVKPSLYRVIQSVDEYADNFRPLRAADTAVAAQRAMKRMLGDGPAADLKTDALRLIREEFELVGASRN